MGNTVQRREIIGTVEQYPTKAAALKACEFRRSTINRETVTPRTLAELVAHYQEHELPIKTPYTKEVYEGYLKTWVTPKWGKYLLSEIRTVNVEAWLKTLPLADGSKAKVRNILSALYSHAQRWEFYNRNPITLVRQSAKRKRTPDVLTADELRALLAELSGVYYTMVYVAAVTGVRASELLALRWSDCDFSAGEINLGRGVVRQNIGSMKTEASKKPIPMEEPLADVLIEWRSQCGYNQDSDWIFASPDKQGRQPLWANSAMEKHIRPAATRAGIQKRVGWHTLRHTFGTLLKASGTDSKVIQELLRHANISVTMDKYVQATTPAKRRAQREIVRQLCPSCALEDFESDVKH
jgi:integrase